MEIAAGIHSIPVPPGAITPFQPTNVYLLLGQQRVLIDTGRNHDTTAEIRVAYLKQVVPAGVDLIIVTHAHIDHIGGAARLKQATGAKLAIHRDDATRARVKHGQEADVLLKEGQVIDLGGRRLEVVHTPGHTPGHICLYLASDAMMFTGDQVVGMGTTAIEPPEGDMAAYVESLRRLRGYDMDIICPGHGPLVRQPTRKLEALIRQREERERQVLRYLKRGLASPRALAAEIYPELKDHMAEVAERHMLAHLLKLEKEGKAAQNSGCWHVVAR